MVMKFELNQLIMWHVCLCECICLHRCTCMAGYWQIPHGQTCWCSFLQMQRSVCNWMQHGTGCIMPLVSIYFMSFLLSFLSVCLTLPLLMGEMPAHLPFFRPISQVLHACLMSSWGTGHDCSDKRSPLPRKISIQLLASNCQVSGKSL